MDNLTTNIGTELLFENEYVRVWNLILEAGEATSWHKHELDYMFVVIQNGKVQTEYTDGTIEKQDDEIGKVSMRRKDTPHRLVNLGDNRYFNVVIEFKNQNG